MGRNLKQYAKKTTVKKSNKVRPIVELTTLWEGGFEASFYGIRYSQVQNPKYLCNNVLLRLTCIWKKTKLDHGP